MTDPSAVAATTRGVGDLHQPTAPTTRTGRKGPRRPALLLSVLASVVLAAVLTGLLVRDGSSSGSDDQPRAAQPITEYAPGERGEPVAVAGRDLAGKPLDTVGLRGGAVVLNVWGSWCAPCRTEAPVLRTLSAEYAGRGVRFLGINVKDNPAAAGAFERRYGISYPSLDDRSGEATLALSRYLPASVVPATLVLDREGRVAARVLGAVEASTLRALLESVTAP